MDWRGQEVLDTRRAYSGMGLWPAIPKDMDPEGWLRNFRDEKDRNIAVALLDSLVHITTVQARRLLESAFHSISYEVERERGVLPYGGASWSKYRQEVLVSYPMADERDPAASGRIFVHQARAQLVPFASQLLDPIDLVEDLHRTSEPKDVLLLDDFSGTGDQFIEAMDLKHSVPNFEEHSLRMLYDDGKIRSLTFATAVMTTSAMTRISSEFPGLRIATAHRLPGEYGAGHDKTLLVPSSMRQDLVPFLERHADRYGFTPETVLGHGNCGLALSFEHSFPDNSLPILWAEAAGWTTLRKRVQA